MRFFNSCTENADSIFSILERRSDVVFTPDSLYVIEQLLAKYTFPLVVGVAKKNKTISSMVFCLENKKNLSDSQKYNDMEIDFKAPKAFSTILNWYDSTLVNASDMRSIILLCKACDYDVIIDSISESKKKCIHSVPYLKAVCVTKQREANEAKKKAEEVNKKIEEAKSIFIKDTETISNDEADRIKLEESMWDF